MLDGGAVQGCERFDAHCHGMAEGSRRLSAGIDLLNNKCWPCGHRRTPENTQAVGSLFRCRVCRRRRWQTAFRKAVARNLMVQSREQYWKQRHHDGVQLTAANYHRAQNLLAHSPGQGRLPFQFLVDAVALHFGLTAEEVKGKARGAKFVTARAVVIAILRERGMSLPKIARLFDRDHSTIKWAFDQLDIYARRDDRVALALYKFRDRPQ